eukprot:TRINITY_DN6128_c0_g1_i1.p1 TRINITY_DN6128_c0_g1~~TRINITY_DN6128_c0_g1_i1.p1  ORF type:complete len:857 (-),score=157.55 TRINITY_DN6128_c0_g1_i1:229-2799(-)
MSNTTDNTTDSTGFVYDEEFLYVKDFVGDLIVTIPIFCFVLLSYFFQRFASRPCAKLFRARDTLYLNYLRSDFSLVVEIIRLIMSVISLGVFAYMSIRVSWTNDEAEFQDIFKTDNWYLKIEGILSIVFALYYIFQILCHPAVFSYVMSPVAIANLLNTLQGLQILWNPYFSWFFHPFRCFSVYDALSRINVKVNRGAFSKKRNEIILYLITIVCFLFGVSGTLFTMENQFYGGPLYNLFDSFYFIIISLTTVGYGDISPATPLGKIAISVVIVSAIAIIPRLTNNLVSILQNRRTSTYDNRNTHVVMYIEPQANATFFLKEFFHEDRQFSSVNLAIICEDLHSDVKELIKLPYLRNRIDWLEGDLAFSRDIQRTKIREADAAFFIVSNEENNDPKNILTSFLLKRENRGIKLYTQVLDKDTKENELEKERSKRLIENLSFGTELSRARIEKLKKDPVPVYLSFEEVKMRLLAHSCLHPSYTTLVSNLFCSVSASSVKNKWNHFLDEYELGLGNEVYTGVDLSSFEGETFEAAAFYIYHYHKCTLIGITDKSKTVVLNPQRFELDGSYYGIVLAQDESVVQKIFKKPLQEAFIDKLFLEYPEKSVKYVKDTYKEYYTSPRRSLEECIFYTTKDILQNHVIIVTDDIIKGYRSIIQMLRSKYLSSFDPIIFLCPQRPNPTVWAYLTKYPGVYFMEGSGMNRLDLIRAGIRYASKVVITSTGNDFSSDARSVLAFKLIEGIVREYSSSGIRCKAMPVIELVNNHSNRFLAKPSIGDELHKQQSENERDRAGDFRNVYYLSGQIFYPSVGQNILAQEYFSGCAINLFTELTETYAVRVSKWNNLEIFEVKLIILLTKRI